MNIKRQRGRGRNKPANNNPNRAYESNGPDIRVRGSAQTILEKYQQAGRDAMASGDRILAENYMQHAEHYLRLLKSIQPHFVPRSEMAISGIPSENEDENGENLNTEGENNYAEGEEDDNDAPSSRNDNRNERENRPDRNDRFNNNNRRRGRDRYRNNRNEGEENGDSAPEIVENNFETAPEADAPQGSDFTPETTDEAKPRNPRGTSRLRSPLGRRPRQKRPETDKEPAGFGEDMPAFLTTTVSE